MPSQTLLPAEVACIRLAAGPMRRLSRQQVIFVLLRKVTSLPTNPAWSCGSEASTSVHCQAPSRQVIEWAGHNMPVLDTSIGGRHACNLSIMHRLVLCKRGYVRVTLAIVWLVLHPLSAHCAMNLHHACALMALLLFLKRIAPCWITKGASGVGKKGN